MLVMSDGEMVLPTTKKAAKKLETPYRKKRIEVHYELRCPFCDYEVERNEAYEVWECMCSEWEVDPYKPAVRHIKAGQTK